MYFELGKPYLIQTTGDYIIGQVKYFHVTPSQVLLSVELEDGRTLNGANVIGWGPHIPHNPRRLKSCVEQWPECEEGAYHPSCCRFPKSCSCTVYDPKRVQESDLE